MSTSNGVLHPSAPPHHPPLPPPIFTLIPFDVGSLCLCRLSPDDWKLAEIIDKRPAPSPTPDTDPLLSSHPLHYYVHFRDHNRRLDRWVSEAELRPAPSPEPPFIVYSPTSLQQLQVASPVLHSSALVLSSPAPYRTAAPFPTVVPPYSPLHAPFPFHPAFSHLSSPVSTPLPSPSKPSPSLPAPIDRRLTRLERRLTSHHSPDDSQLVYTDECEVEIEKEHAEKTKVRNIQHITVSTPASSRPAPTPEGGYGLPLSSSHRVDCWYYSPYPAPYRALPLLHICGFCFAYFDSQAALTAHWLSPCPLHHPPGLEVYRDDAAGVSVWEVDGARHRLYCANVCLLSKLFIDHKTAIYDTDPFLFYLLTRHLPNGHCLVGYFSREKQSAEGNNVACILTFPQHQRAGYGRFLIALSYQLSTLEGRPGGPERPLSDLGRVSYRSWWGERLQALLAGYGEGAVCGVEELSAATGMKREDIVRVLREQGMVRYVKGEHMVTVEGRKMDDWRQRMEAERLQSAAGRVAARGGAAAQAGEGAGRRCEFDPRLLHWKPPQFPRWTGAGVRDRRSRPNGSAGHHSSHRTKDGNGDTEPGVKRRREDSDE